MDAADATAESEPYDKQLVVICCVYFRENNVAVRTGHRSRHRCGIDSRSFGAFGAVESSGEQWRMIQRGRDLKFEIIQFRFLFVKHFSRCSDRAGEMR